MHALGPPLLFLVWSYRVAFVGLPVCALVGIPGLTKICGVVLAASFLTLAIFGGRGGEDSDDGDTTGGSEDLW